MQVHVSRPRWGLGLLAVLLVTACTSPRVSDQTSARSDIARITEACDQFAILNNGRYPDSLDLLVTPDVNGATYLGTTRLPRDPWGHPYGYEPPSTDRPWAVVYTLGADGRPGGTGSDADFDSEGLREGR